jgi:uncharacterized protein YodC (DUF2158 family)
MKPAILRQQAHYIYDLHLVAKAETYRDPSAPPLAIGNRVRLNSGGPTLLVVDCNGDSAVVARDKEGVVEEYSFPERCLYLV